MISRRALVAAAPALAIAAPVCASLLRPSILESAKGGAKDGLRSYAAARGLVFGAAAASYQLRDAMYAATFAREAALLVPEYEMKRGVIEPARGRYDFSGCDALVAFAAANGIAMRGHPLLWHKRNPAWLEEAVTNSRDPRLITDYIAAVMARFGSRVHSWDVINEVIAPADGRKDNLRETFWLKAFGPSYIDETYHAARAASADAMLVYNDWGFEAGGAENDRFRAATLEFLSGALARGVPIDALGVQGHLAAFGAPVNQAKLARFLSEVRSLGVRILVTEHDVDDSGGTSDAAVRDQAVADASRRFLDVVLDNRATIAVLTWGLSDRFLAQPGWRERLAGYSPRMLPLDSDLARTPMWHAMAKGFG